MRKYGIIGVCLIAFLAIMRRPTVRAAVATMLIAEGQHMIDTLPDAPMRPGFEEELLDELYLRMNGCLL